MSKQVLLVILIILLNAIFPSAYAKSPQVGDLAPQIEVTDFNLKANKGKFVVIYFYPKDHTLNCTIQSKQFAAKFDEFKALNTEIVGISADTEQSHMNFKAKYNILFTLIADKDKKIINSYDVNSLIWPQRVTFLIDRDGKIAYIWRKIRVSTHAQEVLNKIKELNPAS